MADDETNQRIKILFQKAQKNYEEAILLRAEASVLRHRLYREANELDFRIAGLKRVLEEHQEADQKASAAAGNAG